VKGHGADNGIRRDGARAARTGGGAVDGLQRGCTGRRGAVDWRRRGGSRAVRTSGGRDGRELQDEGPTHVDGSYYSFRRPSEPATCSADPPTAVDAGVLRAGGLAHTTALTWLLLQGLTPPDACGSTA